MSKKIILDTKPTSTKRDIVRNSLNLNLNGELESTRKLIRSKLSYPTKTFKVEIQVNLQQSIKRLLNVNHDSKVRYGGETRVETVSDGKQRAYTKYSEIEKRRVLLTGNDSVTFVEASEKTPIESNDVSINPPIGGAITDDSLTAEENAELEQVKLAGGESKHDSGKDTDTKTKVQKKGNN